MIRNPTRHRAASAISKRITRVDPYDLPRMLKAARRCHLERLRDADRKGQLNERYGPKQIFLDYLEDDEEDLDFSEMHSCAGIVWMATYRAVDSIRNFFTNFVYRPGNLPDLESGSPSNTSLSPYNFKLGPHTRHFENSAMADAPQWGNLLTYKVVVGKGVQLDVLEVDIPDKKAVLKNVIDCERDVQAEILNERCASLIWIFHARTQIILVTESSSPHAWTPQQWFRKILSDMALADSIMIGHPYYWHPIVKRRLSKAVRSFKRLYKTISDQSVAVKENLSNSVLNPSTVTRVHPDDPNLPKSDVVKYRSKQGRECVKAMEYFPHTRTKVSVGNYSIRGDKSKSMDEVVNNLFNEWETYMTNVKSSQPFVSLKDQIELETEHERLQARKKKEIAQVISEIEVLCPGQNATPNYKGTYVKSIDSDPGLLEVLPSRGSKKSLVETKSSKFNSRTSRASVVPLHKTSERIDLSALRSLPEVDEDEEEIQVIKSADMNIKTNYSSGGPSTSAVCSGEESRWKDSVYSQSETGGSGVVVTARPRSRTKSRCKSRKNQEPHKGVSRSEGFLAATAAAEDRSDRSPMFEQEPHDRAAPSASGGKPASASAAALSSLPPRKPKRRQHEGSTSARFEDEDPGEDSGFILKLGPSKTRHHHGHGASGGIEIGPPVLTFNEPFAMPFRPGGAQQQLHPEFGYHGSEIPPADADSLSALTPHGLNSREGLLGVVDQLGLETPAISLTHGYGVQQHRGGSGTRGNASNFHGAYHAVTHNKSLESLDLGHPSGLSCSSPRTRTGAGKGKLGGNRCSQSHLHDEPH